jgi:hypothetical protein
MSNKIRNLKALFYIGAMALAISPGADTSRAEDGAFDAGYVKIEVEDISYLGEDSYRIELALQNQSGSDVSIKDVSGEFSVQTEVIGRWAPIEADIEFPVAGGAISSGGALRYDAVVAIPLDIPRLYLNAYGDVNLRFRYRAGFTADGGSRAFQRTGEGSYWITPGTSEWVLREGM